MNRIGDRLICSGDNESLAKALNERKVDCLLIGGLAVAWYCPDRQADDMDLLVRPTIENSRQISLALQAVGAGHVSEDAFARPGIQAPLKGQFYAELLTPREDWPSYELLTTDAVDGLLFSVPMRIASLTTLILLKQIASGHEGPESEKHRRDIERLECVQERLRADER